MSRGIEDLDGDLVVDIIQEEIASYIDLGLKLMDTGTPDRLDTETWKHAIYRARHLNLAEPWLPAVRAAQRLRAAGLATTVGAPGHLPEATS